MNVGVFEGEDGHDGIDEEFMDLYFKDVLDSVYS